ncbi:hypothetical protein FRB94_009326 [Tulasnella sp. JGI-2019a]|nr:hypothetical protein FRB94_009326 [Tulasnella sp. JGI-2019a]
MMSSGLAESGPKDDVFQQDLVFSPEMVQVSPAELEIGSIFGSTLCYRRKGKSSKADSPVLMVDLVEGKGAGQFVADGLPLESSGTTSGIASVMNAVGILSADRSTFACVKGELFPRHSTLYAGELTLNIDRTLDTISTWIRSSDPSYGNKTLILADPYKRQVYTWPIATISHSPPRKLFDCSCILPEGTASRIRDVAHFPSTGGSVNGGWVVLTEWMQWPLLKAMQGSFYAGMLRVSRVTTSGTISGDVRDVWGHAGAFVDVPMGGNTWKTLFCYANRMNPRERMKLHYQDIDTPTLQPGERHSSGSDSLHFSVEIPTYDATDVPSHVHVVPGSLIVVVTVTGALHAFTLEGELVKSSQIRLAPGRNVSISCFSTTDSQGHTHLYARTGQLIRRISTQY